MGENGNNEDFPKDSRIIEKEDTPSNEDGIPSKTGVIFTANEQNRLVEVISCTDSVIDNPSTLGGSPKKVKKDTDKNNENIIDLTIGNSNSPSFQVVDMQSFSEKTDEAKMKNGDDNIDLTAAGKILPLSYIKNFNKKLQDSVPSTSHELPIIDPKYNPPCISKPSYRVSLNRFDDNRPLLFPQVARELPAFHEHFHEMGLYPRSPFYRPRNSSLIVPYRTFYNKESSFICEEDTLSMSSVEDLLPSDEETETLSDPTHYVKKKISLTDLPDVVLLHIMKFLDSWDLISLNRVNVQLSNLTRDYSLWENVDLRGRRMGPKELQRILPFLSSRTKSFATKGPLKEKRFSWAGRLYCRGCRDWDGSRIIVISRTLPGGFMSFHSSNRLDMFGNNNCFSDFPLAAAAGDQQRINNSAHCRFQDNEHNPNIVIPNLSILPSQNQRNIIPSSVTISPVINNNKSSTGGRKRNHKETIASGSLFRNTEHEDVKQNMNKEKDYLHPKKTGKKVNIVADVPENPCLLDASNRNLSNLSSNATFDCEEGEKVKCPTNSKNNINVPNYSQAFPSVSDNSKLLFDKKKPKLTNPKVVEVPVDYSVSRRNDNNDVDIKRFKESSCEASASTSKGNADDNHSTENSLFFNQFRSRNHYGNIKLGIDNTNESSSSFINNFEGCSTLDNNSSRQPENISWGSYNSSTNVPSTSNPGNLNFLNIDKSYNHCGCDACIKIKMGYRDSDFNEFCEQKRREKKREKNRSLAITRDFLFKLSIVAPKLETLILEDHVLNARDVLIKNFPASLTTLRLNRCKVLNLIGHQSYFSKFNQFLQRLRVLDIADSPWFEPHSLLAISKSDIEELNLSGCEVNECLPYISLAANYGFKNLKVLDLSMTLVSDVEVICFERMALTALYLQAPPQSVRPYCSHNHDYFNILFNNATQRPAPMITNFSITKFGGPLEEREPHNNPLDVRFGRYGGIKIQYIDQMVRMPTKFERFAVRDYPRVTDISLFHIQKFWRELKFLDIRGSGISEEAIEDFQKFRPEVELLH